MRRRRTTSLFAAAATTISLVLVSAPQAGAAPASETEIQAQLYLAYAPMIYLAQDETKRPTNPQAFIDHSALGWSHDACPDHQIAGLGAVSSYALGPGVYEHTTSNSVCQHSNTTYRSNQDVRPHDSPEGMYLDLDNAQRGMGSVRAELYYDYQKGDHITYWFFYAYNDGPAVQNHEGDWERISIKLSATNQPVTVAFFGHGGSCVLSYPSVTRIGTHPVGYSALGTHATYPRVGTHPTKYGFKDTTSKGEAWATYTRPIHNVKDMPWYGYGGAWGEVGQFSDTTGPRGPSAFKSPTPSSWTSPACF
ncbi:hypothetical protein [Longispora urticae]